MKPKILNYFMAFLLLGTFSSCSISSRTMKTPNYHIEFYKSDFEYSPQVSAQAKSTRILMIDWNRIFEWKNGELSSDRFQNTFMDTNATASGLINPIAGTVSSVIPVVGDNRKGRVSSYALFNLMTENPGYDVVIYPQYEAKKFVFPFFYSKTTVIVTARLGKIK